jgi:predicted nucleic acid-binding protein
VIITDTGFWLALANRRDRYHDKCVAVLAEVKEPLVTTWPVITETCHLLLSRMGTDAELQFVDSARAGAFEVFSLEASHLTRIHELMDQYRELPMDLADASLVILAEHLGAGRVLSTDLRDFGAYRWKNRKPFKNLLAL